MGVRAGRGFTLLELTVVIAMIGILAAMLFPVFARSREMARRAQCAANVAELGLALQLYAADWGGVYPPHEDDLGPIAARIGTDATFRCPSSQFGGLTVTERAFAAKAKHTRVLPVWPGAPVAKQDVMEYEPVLADGRLLGCSYYYHAGLSTESPPDLVLVTEREAAHLGSANVLYTSGRVARVPEVRWRTLLPTSAQRTEKDFPSEEDGPPGWRPPAYGRGRGGRR